MLRSSCTTVALHICTLQSAPPLQLHHCALQPLSSSLALHAACPPADHARVLQLHSSHPLPPLLQSSLTAAPFELQVHQHRPPPHPYPSSTSGPMVCILPRTPIPSPSVSKLTRGSGQTVIRPLKVFPVNVKNLSREFKFARFTKSEKQTWYLIKCFEFDLLCSLSK